MKKILFIFLTLFLIGCNSSKTIPDEKPADEPSETEGNLPAESEEPDTFVDFDWEYEDVKSTKKMINYTDEEWEEYISNNKGVKSNGLVFYHFGNPNEYCVLCCYGDLKEVVIPDYFEGLPVAGIRFNAYARSSKTIETITIGKNVTGGIDPYAFEGCTSLKSISIDKDNERFIMSDGAIYTKDYSCLVYCPIYLKGAFKIRDETQYIESSAFNEAENITELYIGKSLLKTGIYFPNMFDNMRSLEKFVVSDENPYYRSYEGVLFSKDGTELIKYPQTKEGDYRIPSEVVNINGSAFTFCFNLNKLTLKDYSMFKTFCFFGSSSIKEFAFYNSDGCSLYNGDIYSPDFSELIFAAPGKERVEVREGTINLNGVSISGANTRCVIIPDSVKTIQRQAVVCANLESLVLGHGVEKIENDAFGRDFINFNVEKLFYKGTIEELQQIDIGYSNGVLAQASRYYYSETEPEINKKHYWHYVDGEPTIWK